MSCVHTSTPRSPRHSRPRNFRQIHLLSGVEHSSGGPTGAMLASSASASSGQMAGLCVPRRSPTPLLPRRGRLHPRRPAALLPRARAPALRPVAAAASPPPPSADSAVSPPVCLLPGDFVVIPRPRVWPAGTRVLAPPFRQVFLPTSDITDSGERWAPAVQSPRRSLPGSAQIPLSASGKAIGALLVEDPPNFGPPLIGSRFPYIKC